MYKVLSLEKQIQDTQTQSLLTSIELRNVPFNEKGKETTAELVSTVKAVGPAVNMELHSTNLRDVYRISSTSPALIVADFASVSTRHEFLSSVKRFNKAQNKQDKLNSHTIGIPGRKAPIHL